jgi:glycosyltransferase involved in cell wall biosynthesis
MKIFLLITRGNQGGAQTNVLSLARGAVRGGHEVKIGTGEDGWLATEAVSSGIPVVFFRSLRRSWNPWQLFKFRSELKAELQRDPVDILHMHSSNALFGALTARKIKNHPYLVATVHGLSVLNPGWRGNRIIRSIYTRTMRFLWRHCDRLIFVCQSDLDDVSARKLVRVEQCRVVLNGINPKIDFFARAHARQQLFIPDTSFVVGTVARLEYSKDIDLFLNTADILRQEKITFRIVGDGPDRQHLLKAIEKLRLVDRVQIYTQAQNGYKFLPAFDLFLMTSRYEGLPYTLLEAGLAGLPVVAIDVGGISEIIQTGISGLLSRERTPAALANAIEYLMNDRSEARFMGAAAQQNIKTEFLEGRMIEQVLAIYLKP